MGRGPSSLDAIHQAMQRKKAAETEEKLAAIAAELTKRSSGQRTDGLLTSKEIAPYVGVTHPKTVERWVREKGLPCVRIGRNLRFDLGDVRRWLAQQKER